MAKTEPRDRINRLLVTVNTAERNIIQGHAAACSMSVSSYLRALGVGHEPKSKLDAQVGLELCKTRADLAHLGTLLKLWLTEKDGLGAAPDDVRALLAKVQETADAARDRVRAL